MKNGEFNWICHVWACLPRVCSHWLKLMEFKIIRFNYSDMISCKLKMQWLRCVNVFYLYISGYACNSNTIWQDNRRHNTHLSGMAQHVWCKIYHLCLMLLHRPGSYMTNIVFLCVLGQLSPDMSIPYYTQQPLPVYFYRCQANRRQRLSHPAEGLLENTCYHRNTGDTRFNNMDNFRKTTKNEIDFRSPLSILMWRFGRYMLHYLKTRRQEELLLKFISR